MLRGLAGAARRFAALIGDCADLPNATLRFRTRLESVQNAVDQARCVAARLAGKPEPYEGERACRAIKERAQSSLKTCVRFFIADRMHP